MLSSACVSYLYIPSARHSAGAAALLRAPDTWERFRYLVFAEQFRGLFDRLRDTRSDFVDEVGRGRGRPGRADPVVGWLLVARGRGDPGGAPPRGVRLPRPGRRRDVLYAMNFQRRRHRPLLPAGDRGHRAADRRGGGIHRGQRRPSRRGDQPALRGQPPATAMAGDRGGGHDRGARRAAARPRRWSPATGHTTRARTGPRTSGSHRSTSSCRPTR